MTSPSLGDPALGRPAEMLAEWGLPGVSALHARAAVLVVVDVLSFCTTVDIATARGARVLPFGFADERAARAEAVRQGALLAGRRGSAEGYSLSPASMLAIPAGTAVLLPSPNGSRIAFAASRTPGRIPVLAGCLRNASAVARAALGLAAGGSVAVIPAGEHWPDGTPRVALEDMLGAGAILDRLDLPGTPEADAMRDAWRGAAGELARTLRLCVSGRELADRGFPGDVELAAEHDASRCVPIFRDGAFVAMTDPG